MTDSASMTMLKKAGAKAQAVSDELGPSPEAGPSSGPEETNASAVVEIDDMTSEDLDVLCKNEGVETPAEWPLWDAPAKRAWLKAQYGSPDKAPEQMAEQAVGEGTESPNPLPQTAAGIKAAKKTKSKSKFAAPPSTEVGPSLVKEGVVVEGDVLQDLVHEIENLKEKAAYELIDNLIEQTDVTYFKLGGVLSVCVSNQWNQGYPSFKDMLEGKYGVHYRKGMYLIEIYNKLSNSGISWEKLKPLGWSKVQIVAPVLTTDNVDTWLKIASEQNNLTLIETVKNSKKPLLEGPPEVKSVTALTFKVHSDQKATVEAALDKAKQQSSTDVASVALEFICLDFLGGSTLKDRVKAAGPVALGKIINELFAEDPVGYGKVMEQTDIEKSLNAIGAAAPQLNITVSLAEDGTGEQAA